MAPRPSEGKGRRRFRSSGGGSFVSTAAGFSLGVAFTLLFLSWHHDPGGLLDATAETSSRADSQNGHNSTGSKALAITTGGRVKATSRARGARRSMPPLNLTDPHGVARAVEAAAAAAADEIEERLDVGSLPHLFLSYGNAAYFDFVHNWAISVQQIGAPYVIGSFDDAMLDLCDTHSLPCVRAQFASADDFRGDFAAFRAMGAVKVRLVLEILERHPQLPLLVVSDSDTVWQRQPWTYFEHRPTADFFVSTDCLSIQLEEEWKPRRDKATCGHIPGSWGYAFNTGLFAARNRPISRRLLRDWVEMLTNPAKEKDSAGRGMDDQLALNLLFDTDGKMEAEGPKSAGKDDPRTILVYNGTMKLQPLPVALFSGGHVAFVQRTPWKHGVEPIVIHMTYQRWWNDGKRARLREFGLWHIDPPEYYGAGANDTLKLLTYENGVVPFVEAVAAQRYTGGTEMPLFYKNWLGMSYQLAAFRDALAAARMLERTVVLPTLWCWCDYEEQPDILLTCMKLGADYSVPFECPLDFMLDIEIIDAQKINYRNAGFLDLHQVPEKIQHSRALVRIADSKPAVPFPRIQSMAGYYATVWPGISQAELERVVEPIESAAVLEFRGFVPGFLGGWKEAEAAAQFDEEWGASMEEARWCCATWGWHDEEYRTIRYAYPRPFGEGWQPWTAPVMTPPDWCDKVSEQDGNRRFTRHPQHPCKFLRDIEGAATAAAAGQQAAGS